MVLVYKPNSDALKKNSPTVNNLLGVLAVYNLFMNY